MHELSLVYMREGTGKSTHNHNDNKNEQVKEDKKKHTN